MSWWIATRFMVSQQPDLQMLNRYILGQALGIPPLLIGQQLFAFLSLENRTAFQAKVRLTRETENCIIHLIFQTQGVT